MLNVKKLLLWWNSNLIIEQFKNIITLWATTFQWI